MEGFSATMSWNTSLIHTLVTHVLENRYAINIVLQANSNYHFREFCVTRPKANSTALEFDPGPFYLKPDVLTLSHSYSMITPTKAFALAYLGYVSHSLKNYHFEFRALVKRIEHDTQCMLCRDNELNEFISSLHYCFLPLTFLMGIL